MVISQTRLMSEEEYSDDDLSESLSLDGEPDPDTISLDDNNTNLLLDDDEDFALDDDTECLNVCEGQMTKYTRVKMLCLRTQQLEAGMPSVLSFSQLASVTSPLEIARLELDSGVMPLRILSRVNCMRV